MKYTFGTDEAAARRLGDIARFFNPPAVDFIREHVRGPVGSALDLGCGPGYTTDMLSSAIDCPDVRGMDISSQFLRMAAERFPHCTFIEHDVTKTPFPFRAEVLYVRFLLSHLREVVDLVNRWTNQLRPHGQLFGDELESADTEVPVFQEYLAVNEGLVASQGASLYVGGRLAGGNYDAEVLSNECMEIPVPNHTVATWFLPNTLTVLGRRAVCPGEGFPEQKKRNCRRDPANQGSRRYRRVKHLEDEKARAAEAVSGPMSPKPTLH